MDRETDSTNREFVEALARGLAVIEAFSETQPEMALADVARVTGMSAATARRSLHTLETLGFVQRHNKRFLLAPRVLTLGSAYLRAARVDEVLMPELRRVVTRFGDAASVAILMGADILYVAHFSEERAGRRTAGIGIKYPAYATSLGRILVANLPPEELDAYLASLKPSKLTDFTVTDIKKLRAILTDAKHKGYTVAVDQLDYGITSLAAPIKYAGKVIAAINTSGYSPRIVIDELVKQRLPELRIAANHISDLLGKYPALAHSLPTDTSVT